MCKNLHAPSLASLFPIDSVLEEEHSPFSKLQFKFVHKVIIMPSMIAMHAATGSAVCHRVGIARHAQLQPRLTLAGRKTALNAPINAKRIQQTRIYAEVSQCSPLCYIICLSYSRFSRFMVPHAYLLSSHLSHLQDAKSGGGNGTDAPVMTMIDSLIERAHEVATSGTVDAAFREKYVDELKAELEILQQRASSAESSANAFEETLKSMKDQFVRLSADFDNFRKRTSTEREALKSSVKGDTVMALLPLVDNFELAKSQLKLETEGEEKVAAAYQGLYKQMVEVFRGMGLEAVAGVGELFDPELHEAIMREPSEDVPDGTILEEFRKGFRLGDRLLRPAMVKVSFSDAPVAAAAAVESETEVEVSGDEGTQSE